MKTAVLKRQQYKIVKSVNSYHQPLSLYILLPVVFSPHRLVLHSNPNHSPPTLKLPTTLKLHWVSRVPAFEPLVQPLKEKQPNTSGHLAVFLGDPGGVRTRDLRLEKATS